MDIETRCCIAGGGPAGLMLGYLLARAGVEVVVLEKHADFLRDFRGDTIHPSTMESMHELGLLDQFLQLPHAAFDHLSFDFEGEEVMVADFATLPVAAKYVAMMPQWDFLDFIADHAKSLPGFTLMMETEATGLIEEGGSVVGVRAEGRDGPVTVRAGLTVAADGRGSALRDASGLAARALGAPIDVMWFRLSHKAGDPDGSLGRLRGGKIVVMLDRGDYWQCAWVVAKGGAEAIRARGLEAFRSVVADATGLPRDRTAELADWDDVKVLDVRLDRMPRWWRPGFLAIGDAAHAMSPIGGVGVNLAIADAVAAANILEGPLRAGAADTRVLEQVQARREGPVRLIQKVQQLAQDRVILPVIEGSPAMPLPLRALRAVPWLNRLPTRAIGLGVRMEHVSDRIRASG